MVLVLGSGGGWVAGAGAGTGTKLIILGRKWAGRAVGTS